MITQTTIHFYGSWINKLVSKLAKTSYFHFMAEIALAFVIPMKYTSIFHFLFAQLIVRGCTMIT